MENVTPHPCEQGACWPLGCPMGASPGFELHQCAQSSGVLFQTKHFYTVFQFFSCILADLNCWGAARLQPGCQMAIFWALSAWDGLNLFEVENFSVCQYPLIWLPAAFYSTEGREWLLMLTRCSPDSAQEQLQSLGLGFQTRGNKRGFAGREVHKWQITNSSAGPDALGCAFGRMQIFPMPHFQGYNLSLICQDGAKPVLPFFAPTHFCSAPAKTAVICKVFAGGK